MKQKNPQKKHTQNKTKQKIKERKCEKRNHPIFPNDFSHVVSSSKSLEHNPFTLLKFCYLLGAIFFLKVIVLFELFKAISFYILLTFWISAIRLFMFINFFSLHL